MIQIIIPTYNEAGNIREIIARIRESAPEARILVVDDNSPDGTGSIVAEIALQDAHVQLLSRGGKEGLGKAYLHAFQESLKDETISAVIMMDADFSHDPEYLPVLIRTSEGIHAVTGSRYVPGGATEGWEGWRRYLSTFGNIYCRIITRLPVHDVTAGFNLIPTNALRAINLEALASSGYAFQVELKYMLWKNGTTFKEIPILFKNRREGESKISNHIIAEGLIAPWKMVYKHLVA